jgi:hypothetical protein
MRTILILSVLVGFLSGTVFAAESIATGARPDVSVIAQAGPGVTTLTIRDEGGTPFAGPITRLVVLPAGAVEPSVRLLDGEATLSGIEVTSGTPMILRGLTVLPVTVTASLESSAKSTTDSPRQIRVEVAYREKSTGKQADAVPTAVRFSRGFYAPFAPLLPEDQSGMLSAAGTGGYLIISDPLFLPALEPLAAWKTEKGFQTTLVATNQTGGTNRQIQEYIADAYREWAVPPQYVLLVGDVDVLPAFSFHSSTSDHPYSLVDGTDFLPDLEVGRLSVRTFAEAQTIVAKILRYEKDPYIGDDPDWYKRALVVGADYGSTTPRAVSRWSREQLLSTGYTQVDSCYFPPFFVDYFHTIPNTINAGVSIVSYRGWAYGIHGWEPPHFTSTEIPSLTNGWKLPVVFSFVCQNNDFGQPECFGEAWLRAGTPTEPKGAVAFIGNTEPWSHTRFNDACAIGAFNAIHGDGVRGMGEILNAAKHECLVEFPAEIPYLSDTDESVEFYYHIYNLLGDPEMMIRTTNPQPIEVTYESRIPQGSNFLDVRVWETGGATPVPGARVGVAQGGTLLACGWTGSDGIARIPYSFESTANPVTITVTGPNLLPFQGTATVFAADAAPYLAFQQLTIDDDADGASRGNGDGIANPGETLELRVTLRNRSTQPAGETTATLTALHGEEIVSGSIGYGSVAAGADGTSPDPFVVKIPIGTEDGRIALFRILASPEGETPTPQNTSESGLEFPVHSPSLRHESSLLAGDGILSPGEVTDLSVTLHNDGSIPSSASVAVLRSLTPELVSVVGATAAFPAAAPGASGSTAEPFRIQAASTAAIGQAAVLEIELTMTEGYVNRTSFSVTVGTADHSSPLGPDPYGYYAYDNSDTDYPDAAPLYDWIPCSTLYGGSGTKLMLRDNMTVKVDLPFTFTYYGNTYDKITVSDNGWISFDLSTYYDFYNWHMPNTYGNSAQIAPFWDNLDPLRKINDVPIADGVYVFHDEGRHLFVVEWSRLPNSRPELDDLQTFELILFDPAYYPTEDGDGIIQCQYKQITNDDDARMYATVGIENEDEDVGLEYSYSNIYPPEAAPISAGLAIRFTTQPPRYNPFRLASFDASGGEAGVQLRWEPGDARPRGGYRVYRATRDGGYVPLADRALDPTARTYLDLTARPDSTYSYRIGSLDPVGRETVFGPFSYAGTAGLGRSLALEARTPNPFRGSALLAYTLPSGGEVSLRIHDLSGRLVRTLVEGRMDAGAYAADWDGRDGEGRDLPSGVYLCRLGAGADHRTLKLTLLR